jgi:hypothetical protein
MARRDRMDSELHSCGSKQCDSKWCNVCKRGLEIDISPRTLYSGMQLDYARSVSLCKKCLNGRSEADVQDLFRTNRKHELGL